ncbi:hypothetical protein QG070_06255 [Kingella kingae]|uniref:hypothetical protein n=1 Tax=Kingella kingae TaxID=504 RepID=UPI0002585586|nr:hypothetical protein [Kingella kingae]EIC12903.1 hypothetical protein KKB_08376 [Kingella kingae PYKK081]MDK4527575.1 hypothetical protein [Kingella kingae]MDK4543205.1 hypothetical protein [Kingella kingae]MDK4544933.1 hypothetical protein [Kingella kingae]MDK4561614.1 hypothetical protein [Kingella kingae]
MHSIESTTQHETLHTYKERRHEKNIIATLATVISVSAYAGDADRFVRNQPSHGTIPALEVVTDNRASLQDNDSQVLRYTGEHTPANLVVEESRNRH